MAVLEELELTPAEAKALVKKGIKYGAYSDDLPTDKKEIHAAAEEIIAFCIDAVVNDKIREELDKDEDDQDADVVDAVEKVNDLLEMAGVTIDDDYNVTYGDSDEDEDEDDEDEDDNDDDEDEDEDEEDDDESPFDPDDYIEGYSELIASSRVKALKKLDPEDEEDLNAIALIKLWEEDQDKPASRVLNWIEENFDFEEDDEDEDDEDEDDNDDDEATDEAEEPWDGYDAATAVEVKKALDEKVEDDEEPLTAEMVEYVKSYEESKDRPRKRILDHCDKLIAQLNEADDEPEEEPAKKTGGLKTTSSKKTTTKKPSKSESAAAVAGLYVVSSEGYENITAYGPLGAAGAVADLLNAGAESVEVSGG